MPEKIVRQVGDSWYTIKVDGTHNPSIVLHYVDESDKACKRLLVIATAKGDADTLTTLIIDELTKVGLSIDKILSQFYDGVLCQGKMEGFRHYSNLT